jgi:adenine/guanine phosphoribosyltransferase-like PRPP-binding protein
MISEYLENSKYEHTSYLENSIRVNRLRETVKHCALALKLHKFDAIAFRGLSGALVAPAVALAMNKEMIAVRKECELDKSANDKTHSDHKVEGFKASRRYIIIDDQICSGKTANSIVEAIKHFAPRAKCVGLLEANYVKRETYKWIDKFGEVTRACDLWVIVQSSYSGFSKVEFTKHVTPRPIDVPKPKKDEVQEKNPDMAKNNNVTPDPIFTATFPDPPRMQPNIAACENRVLGALGELNKLTKGNND